MHLVPPPNSRDLLPPLLACLPTSFVSSRPPPALLPLLAPLLRQRVNFLSHNATKHGWISLLSWDSHRGSKLPAAVEKMDLEPHPVSGELELEEVRPAKYRKLDAETLQARLDVEQFDLSPTYLWCEKDQQGEMDPGWYLSDLQTFDDREDEGTWFDSPSEANEAANSYTTPASTNGLTNDEREDDLTDDGYWDAYDRTLDTQTPENTAPGPVPPSTRRAGGRNSVDRSEEEYYDRYGDEVQPAMDPHDPDESNGALGKSTLNGDSLSYSNHHAVESTQAIIQQSDYLRSLQPHTEWASYDSTVQGAVSHNADKRELSMPRPISPANSSSSVELLEERASEMSDRSADRAQRAVQRHISTDLKSLFRLATASGMDREEFTRIVRTELDVLSMLEQEE